MRFLSIQTMAELSGVSTFTLRAWERRYKALEPQRTDSNRRLYSYDDLEKVRLLKELVSMGYSIKNIANEHVDELKKLVGKTLNSLGPRGNEKFSQSENHSATISKTLHEEQQIVEEILRYISAYDLQKLNSAVNHARLSLGVPRFVMNVASPIFRNVGELVAKGDLTVSQEHALSAILRNQFTQLILSLGPLADLSLPTFALCTKEGDYHEFGILLTAVLCAHEGFPIVYFGPNLPAKAFAEAALALNVNHIIIGSAPLPPEFQLISTRQYMEDLRKIIGNGEKIWLGGYRENMRNEDFEILNINHLPNFESALNVFQKIKKELRRN